MFPECGRNFCSKYHVDQVSGRLVSLAMYTSCKHIFVGGKMSTCHSLCDGRKC